MSTYTKWVPMYVNHEDVGCMDDFTKEGCTTQQFIIPPILGIWCLIIPILGTNKAQGFKLLWTKPSSNNSFTWGIISSSRGVAVLTSVLLQRRRCGACLRREVSLMFVLIARLLSFLDNLLEETLTSLQLTTMREQFLFKTLHFLWKMFSLWVWVRSQDWLPRSLLTIRRSPSS